VNIYGSGGRDQRKWARANKSKGPLPRPSGVPQGKGPQDRKNLQCRSQLANGAAVSPMSLAVSNRQSATVNPSGLGSTVVPAAVGRFSIAPVTLKSAIAQNCGSLLRCCGFGWLVGWSWFVLDGRLIGQRWRVSSSPASATLFFFESVTLEAERPAILGDGTDDVVGCT
jgi:hypothetical protein